MNLSRRELLRISAATALAAALPAPLATAEMHNGMPYRELGRTGERVSLLCMGGSHIGVSRLSDEDAIEMVRHALDEGVNFLDNAWSYNDGRSEELMGKALKDGYRDKAFLMSKSTQRDGEGARRELEDSLRRLDVDTIDLWQLHGVVTADDTRRCYEEGPLEVAQQARNEGKIRYIGFTGHHNPETHVDMIERGFEWDTVQMPVNVLDHHFRSFQKTVLPLANERNIGVIGMKPLGGFSSSIMATDALTAVECLHYAMNQPVSTVCSGMDSWETLTENLYAAKTFEPLDEDTVADILERAEPHATDGALEVYKTRWHGG